MKAALHSTTRPVRDNHFLRSAKLAVLLTAAILFAFGPITSQVFAVSCSSQLSQLDCEAISDNWVDWVPLSGCSSSGSTLTGADNVLKIMNYFVSKHYTPEQAAGIAGNTTVESGNEPTRLQSGAIPKVTTISYANIPANILIAQVGWGIVQWTPPNKIGNYAQSANENPDDLATQVEFLWKQLENKAPNNNEPQAGIDLKKTTTAPDAATVFMNEYERPSKDPNINHLQQRITDAQDALTEFKNAGGGPTSPSADTTEAGCSTTGGIAGTCTTPVPAGDYDKVKAALMSQFKLNLQGFRNADFAVQTYYTACALTQSQAYYSRLITQGPINVVIDSNQTTHCTGFASQSSSGATVTLHGDCDKNFNRYLLAHELGHIFAFRNQSIYHDFAVNIWAQNPPIPDWDCMYHFGDGSTPEECFPAMIGEYLIWNYSYANAAPGYGGSTFQDYPTKYSNYYKFAKDTLFGGVEYKSF